MKPASALAILSFLAVLAAPAHAMNIPAGAFGEGDGFTTHSHGANGTRNCPGASREEKAEATKPSGSDEQSLASKEKADSVRRLQKEFRLM